MSFDLIFVTKVLWAIYASASSIYAVLHIVWAFNAPGWWRQLNGTSYRSSLRASKSIGRLSLVMVVISAAFPYLFFAAVLANIFAVDNSYLINVALIIVVPFAVIGLSKIPLARAARKLDIETRDLSFRRLRSSANLRREGLEDGTFRDND